MAKLTVKTTTGETIELGPSKYIESNFDSMVTFDENSTEISQSSNTRRVNNLVAEITAVFNAPEAEGPPRYLEGYGEDGESRVFVNGNLIESVTLHD